MEAKTKKRAVWLVGLSVGAAAIAGLTYAATKAHAAPAAAPAPPLVPVVTPPNTPSQAGTAQYTLPAGQSGQTVVSVPANGYVTLFLPRGGVWNSLTLQPSGQTVSTSGNEAATFQVSPVPGAIASATGVWTDANGKQWTATISLPTS
jgi:hypothetical protein